MLQFEGWKRALIWLVCVAGLFFAAPNAFYNRVEQHNDAARFVERGIALEPSEEAALGAWPSWAPSGLVNLGLDLRGGAELLIQVNVEEAYESRIDALWPALRDLLRQERAVLGGILRQESAPDQLRVRVRNPEGMDRAVELARTLAQPVVNLTGLTENDINVQVEGDILVLTLSETERLAMDDRTVRQTLEIVRRRIDEVGTREPTIRRQGERRIQLQVPGFGSATELKGLLETTAKLTFNPVVSRTSDANARPQIGEELAPSLDEPGTFYVIESAPVVTGECLVDAQPSFDQNGRPAVNFRFDTVCARLFGDYTAENIGQPFAIVLDGEVISAPVIQSHIPGGSGIITGNFSVEESTELAILLRAGALPVSIDFLQERTVGPELGQDSIDAGKVATIVAFAAVLVFMVLSYGLFGIFANVALIVNIGLIFGLLSMIGATLTLPGIAGIVLTVGMAVDANVLVFERIREELRTAKGPARAIELGYEKALSAILDANITTFITAVILFAMGSGPVRGFAITLGLGIITSVFTAIFVTRLLVIMWFERKRPKTIEV